MKKMTIAGLLCASFLIMGADCAGQDQSTQLEHQRQERASLQAVQAVGMPEITEYQEKRMLKEILELRDKMTPTTTYIVDLNGKLHKVCASVGFGLPYATQFTSPAKIAFSEHETGVATLPQADPNGLYSPSSADGTWILCLNPQTQKASPLYIEPRVIVSPFPLETAP